MTLTKHPRRTWSGFVVAVVVGFAQYALPLLKKFWNWLSNISQMETLKPDLVGFWMDWIEPCLLWMNRVPVWVFPAIGTLIAVVAYVTDRLWDRFFPRTVTGAAPTICSKVSVKSATEDLRQKVKRRIQDKAKDFRQIARMDNAQRHALLTNIAQAEVILTRCLGINLARDFERCWSASGQIEHESIRPPALVQCAENCARFLDGLTVRSSSLGVKSAEELERIEIDVRSALKPSGIASRLAASATQIATGLEVFFDEHSDLRWSNGNNELEARFRVHNKSKTAVVENVRVIGDFLRLDEQENNGAAARELTGVPLRLAMDLSPLVSPPATVHNIHPTDTLEFVLLRARRGKEEFRVLHSKCIKSDSTAIGKLMHDLALTYGTASPTWQQLPSGALPAGRYRITVTARGDGGPGGSLALFVECDNDTLSVKLA